MAHVRMNSSLTGNIINACNLNEDTELNWKKAKREQLNHKHNFFKCLALFGKSSFAFLEQFRVHVLPLGFSLRMN